MFDKILSGIFLIYLPVLLQEGSSGFPLWVHKNLGSLKISLLILVVLLGILLLWEAFAFAAAHRRREAAAPARGKEAPRVATSAASDIAPAEDPFKALMKAKAEEFGLGAEKTTFTPVAVEEVKPELKESISEPVRPSEVETPPIVEKIEKKEPEKAVFTAKEPEEEADPFKALLKSAASISEDKISIPKKEPRTLELPKDSAEADPWKSLLKSAITEEPEKKKEGRKFISLEDIEKAPAETIEGEEKPSVKKFEGKILEIPAEEDLASPGPAEEKKAAPSVDEATKKKMLKLEGSLRKIKDGKENE